MWMYHRSTVLLRRKVQYTKACVCCAMAKVIPQNQTVGMGVISAQTGRSTMQHVFSFPSEKVLLSLHIYIYIYIYIYTHICMCSDIESLDKRNNLVVYLHCFPLFIDTSKECAIFAWCLFWFKNKGRVITVG